MRILVTVQPRMYREALALALQRHRPEAEVLLDSLESLDGVVEDFAPHLLMRNDTDGAGPELRREGILCWVEILYSDGMDARVSINGEVREIQDMSIADLLDLVDEVERLVSA